MPVVFHPGIETGLSHRLNLSAWCLQNHVDGFVDQFEIGGVVNELGTAQKQVVVIAGEAFKKPQKLCVIFLGVVVALELCGPQLLHIPSVKVLMANQA